MHYLDNATFEHNIRNRAVDSGPVVGDLYTLAENVAKSRWLPPWADKDDVVQGLVIAAWETLDRWDGRMQAFTYFTNCMLYQMSKVRKQHLAHSRRFVQADVDRF